MCDYSGRLVAWLDGELPPDEAANVEGHLARCEECRRTVSAYREISASFLDCYEAAMVSSPHTRRLQWAPVLGVAAAAAILLAVALFRPARVESLAIHPPPVAPAPAIAFQHTPAAVTVVPARHRAPPRQVARHVAWRAVEPTVEIAIPADAMFPPGAVPAGFNFVTQVSFAPDGLPQPLRVWP